MLPSREVVAARFAAAVRQAKSERIPPPRGAACRGRLACDVDRSEEAELRRLESGAPVTASVHVNLIDDDEAPPQESGRTPLDELDAIDDSALMEAVEAAAAERSGGEAPGLAPWYSKRAAPAGSSDDGDDGAEPIEFDFEEEGGGAGGEEGGRREGKRQPEKRRSRPVVRRS